MKGKLDLIMFLSVIATVMIVVGIAYWRSNNR